MPILWRRIHLQSPCRWNPDQRNLSTMQGTTRRDNQGLSTERARLISPRASTGLMYSLPFWTELINLINSIGGFHSASG